MIAQLEAVPTLAWRLRGSMKKLFAACVVSAVAFISAVKLYFRAAADGEAPGTLTLSAAMP